MDTSPFVALLSSCKNGNAIAQKPKTLSKSTKDKKLNVELDGCKSSKNAIASKRTYVSVKYCSSIARRAFFKSANRDCARRRKTARTVPTCAVYAVCIVPELFQIIKDV